MTRPYYAETKLIYFISIFSDVKPYEFDAKVIGNQKSKNNNTTPDLITNTESGKIITLILLVSLHLLLFLLDVLDKWILLTYPYHQ